jgi:hypothetical protein
MKNTIKLCGDPHCDAIYHNIPKKITACNDCNGRLIEINEKTYFKKYYNYFFQYDFLTGNLFRPVKKLTDQLSFNF